VHNHYKRIDSAARHRQTCSCQKSNILLIGTTATAKTAPRTDARALLRYRSPSPTRPALTRRGRRKRLENSILSVCKRRLRRREGATRDRLHRRDRQIAPRRRQPAHHAHVSRASAGLSRSSRNDRIGARRRRTQSTRSRNRTSIVSSLRRVSPARTPCPSCRSPAHDVVETEQPPPQIRTDFWYRPAELLLGVLASALTAPMDRLLDDLDSGLLTPSPDTSRVIDGCRPWRAILSILVDVDDLALAYRRRSRRFAEARG